ncbi:MAG: SLC26A/SulP transporter family protein [Polyangiaceae bacterium]|nr:SLC26A/SulP transporter family protein [Polyangiaceae bacterium]
MGEASTTAPEPAERGILSRLREWRVFPALVSGAVSGTLVISFDISLAALIFAGALSNRLSFGIGIFLIGSIIVGTVVSLGSSFKPAIAAPQTDASVITALMALAIAGQIKATDPSIDPFPTIVAAVGLTSLVTGGFFLLLGVRRLGILVRFIPYPVVGGFLAGAGWLLLQGTVIVMLGIPVGLDNVEVMLQPAAAAKYVPGLVFGIFLSAVLRRIRSFLLLPGLLMGGIAVFYAVVYFAGSSVEAVSAGGWLLGPLPEGSLWPPMGLSDLASVQWAILFRNSGDIAAVVAMASITLLLSASSVEVATEQEIDLDRELRWTGIGNMLAAFAGGMVGYLSLAESAMNYKAGANTRLTGIVSVICCVLVAILGASTLSYLPLPVLGGLLSYLGYEILIDTVYEDWFRLRRVEYVVVILILLVIAFRGFLTGVVVGGIFSMFLFAASYSRIEVIRNEISGAHLRSNVSRTVSEESVLEERGNQVYILQLQGYIFFGTAYRLLTRAQERILRAQPVQIRYVVLDFRHVSGIDSSAVASFRRLRRLAESNGVKLILSEVPADVRTHLVRSGVILERGDEICRLFPDLDHGLELCANELIAGAPAGAISPRALSRDLWEAFSGAGDVSRFLRYLERVEAPAGYDLFRQGDASKDLYIIESGELTAWYEIDGKKTKRLRTMGAGSVVGESGLYMDATRSATVTTNSPAILYRLSVDALQRLTREAPELAAAFHQLVARLLAQRIVNTTAPVKSLFN